MQLIIIYFFQLFLPPSSSFESSFRPPIVEGSCVILLLRLSQLHVGWLRHPFFLQPADSLSPTPGRPDPDPRGETAELQRPAEVSCDGCLFFNKICLKVQKSSFTLLCAPERRNFRLYLRTNNEIFTKDFRAIVVDEDGQEQSFPVNRQNFFTGHVIGNILFRVSTSKSFQNKLRCW